MRKVILETERLQMVTTEDEEIAFLHKYIYGDEEVTRFTTGRTFSFDETRAFMKKMFTYDGVLGFAPIIEKSTNQIIGHGGILQFDYYDNPNHYEFGYVFQRASWGLGYATEISLGQIETIKESFPSSTVIATVHPQNVASNRVVKKLGMHFKEEVHKGSRGLRNIYVLEEYHRSLSDYD